VIVVGNVAAQTPQIRHELCSDIAGAVSRSSCDAAVDAVITVVAFNIAHVFNIFIIVVMAAIVTLCWTAWTE
jgi:hypothetical protein